MASANTYAKLIPPPMFMPDEAVTFRLEYSQDLTLLYATLVIDGYEEANYPSMVPDYTGTKVTQQLAVSIAGQGYTEFVLAANTLGFVPDENTPNVLHTGRMKAKVLFGESTQGGHVTNPVFQSNETYVNMFLFADGDFKFIGTPYVADSSVFSADIYYLVNYDYGASGATDIKSYRYFLYDNNYKLITDSGELYDWNSGSTSNHKYKFRNLIDGKTYYVKARLTTNGGYILNTDYEAITVQYADEPVVSSRVVPTNVIGGVHLDIDLSGIQHTAIVIYRSIRDEDEYLELTRLADIRSSITYLDTYAIPERRYIYKVTVLNNDIIVGTYYNYITSQSNVLTISDIMGSYTAVADMVKHPISRNDRGAYVEPMDSHYPYFIVNGSPDYDSGTVTGLFTTVENCEPVINNLAYSEMLRAWLNNGRAKLLTYYTGEAWIVTTTGVQTQDPNNDDLYITSFNWTQIGNANEIDDYEKNGLVVSYD